jgi:hypothetical protein
MLPEKIQTTTQHYEDTDERTTSSYDGGASVGCAGGAAGARGGGGASNGRTVVSITTGSSVGAQKHTDTQTHTCVLRRQGAVVHRGVGRHHAVCYRHKDKGVVR